MLTRVEISNPRTNSLTLELNDNDTGLILDSIEGLGPVKAELTSTGFALIDGEQFQSARRGTRNPVLRILLEPDWGVETVEDLRDRIYEVLMPKSAVDLYFYSDNKPPRVISGIVESAEPEIFTSDPVMAVSILCYDPDYKDVESTTVTGSSSQNLSWMSIDYAGSVPTGLLFEMAPTRIVNEFSIYLNDTQLDFAGSLESGDQLKISTIPGNKYARLTKAGIESSRLSSITAQSTWVQLEPGTNQFRVYALGAAVPFTLTYRNRYGGL